MSNILRIIKIAKPLYKIIFVIAFLILLSSIIELVVPITSKFVVDEIVKQVDGDGGNIKRLYIFITLGFGLSILSRVLGALVERYGDHFAGEVRKFLTEKFYGKILQLPQSYFDSEVSGKIINQLNRGIVSIQGFINNSTNFILPTFIQSIFIIIVLAYYNLMIAAFVTLLFPIYLTISYYSAKRWGMEEVKKNKIEDVTRGRIQEVISNIKLVKGFTNEQNEYALVSGNLGEINQIYAKQSRSYHMFDFFRNLSLTIILFAVDLLVFYNTFQGDLSIGELVLILQLVNRAQMPLIAMSFILEQVQQAEAGSKEFFSVLDLKSKEFYEKIERVDILENPVIEFRDIHFNYESGGKVLEDVSFTLRKGDVTALVGPSGAGKSTIANLILKFYEPTSGEILLNGKSYSELSHKFVRENISLVFQESELFSTTIRENVAYGQEATEEEIIEALRKANAWEFVKKFPKGLDTEVGERGIKLSGGQRQRIQIARVILKNSPVLILDEATSSLDAKSEHEVQEALEVLMKDRLVIIIAHRFSTIQNATKVIVLDENHKIESIGTPNELASKSEIYSTLLNFQIEGNKKLLRKFEIS